MYLNQNKKYNTCHIFVKKLMAIGDHGEHGVHAVPPIVDLVNVVKSVCVITLLLAKMESPVKDQTMSWNPAKSGNVEPQV